MNQRFLVSIFSIIFSVSFVGGSSTCMANAKVDNAPLPAGWTFLPKEKSTKDGILAIDGFFTGSTVKTKAILVENKVDGTYGLAIAMRPNRTAIIVETFKDIAVNPPSLSLIKSGKYHPFCTPNEKQCDAFVVKDQAIGLSFGEASAQIIYFAKSKFKVVHVTD